MYLAVLCYALLQTSKAGWIYTKKVDKYDIIKTSK